MELKDGIGNGMLLADFSATDFTHLGGEQSFIINIPEDDTVLKVKWANGTTNQLTYPKGPISALAVSILVDGSNSVTSLNVTV